MKVHPILNAIFEIKRSRFIQICIFVAQNLYTLDKKSPSKRHFQTFEWLCESSPIFTSYLKPQVSSSLKFASLFSVMRTTLLYFFNLNFILFGQKKPHQSAKFQTFNHSHEISPNLYFDRLLLLKTYKISAKKV